MLQRFYEFQRQGKLGGMGGVVTSQLLVYLSRQENNAAQESDMNSVTIVTTYGTNQKTE